MNAEPAGLTRRGRIVAALAALVLAALALRVGAADALAAPAWLTAWQQQHPDPRVFSDEDSALLASLQGTARRTDVLLLLAALSVGCAALAWRPRLAQTLGGARAAVLAAGSVLVGLWSVGASVAGQVEAARRDEWTLRDDNLDAVAGSFAPTLREWRTRIPEGDAVILLGTDSYLWNITAWALYPRAIYPLVQPVPPGLGADELRAAVAPLDLAHGHGARWVVDLAVLRDGATAAHPALLRVDA